MGYSFDFKCCCCGKECIKGKEGGGGNPEPLKNINGQCLARLDSDNVVCEICDRIVVIYMRRKLWNMPFTEEFIKDTQRLINEVAGEDRYQEYIELIKQFENNELATQSRRHHDDA